MSQIQNEAIFHHKPRNCKHYFPNIKFSYTPSKAIEMTIKSLNTKNAQGHEKFQLNFLNGVLKFLVFY